MHRSEFTKLELSIGTAVGTTTGPQKFVRRALATEESSRARSFARSHARNAIATETEIDFPVRGWANAGLTTPNLRLPRKGLLHGKSHHPSLQIAFPKPFRG